VEKPLVKNLDDLFKVLSQNTPEVERLSRKPSGKRSEVGETGSKMLKGFSMVRGGKSVKKTLIKRRGKQKGKLMKSAISSGDPRKRVHQGRTGVRNLEMEKMKSEMGELGT